MTAAERLKDALKSKTRGLRGPKGEKQLVEVLAADLREIANAGSDPHAANLAKGSAPYTNEPPDRKVIVYADDLFTLLDGGD